MAELDMDARIAEIKLKRIQELNGRLRQTLQQQHIPASQICKLYIEHATETPDYLVPYVWKMPLEDNQYKKFQQFSTLRLGGSGEGPGCCSIM